jgi:hypothetical protein
MSEYIPQKFYLIASLSFEVKSLHKPEWRETGGEGHESQHNDSQYNDSQHNDSQDNDTHATLSKNDS